MVREKRDNTAFNGGYSLIELIVTILVSSIIMVAVVGFLTTGLRHYRNVNAETALQTESQVAELFITELFQESTDFTLLDDSAYPADADIRAAIKIERDGNGYILAQNGTELWFSEVDNSKSDLEQVAELVNNGRSKAFLAQYVNSLMLNGATKFEDAAKGNNGLIQVMVEFQVDQRTYLCTPVISLRNTIKN